MTAAYGSEKNTKNQEASQFRYIPPKHSSGRTGKIYEKFGAQFASRTINISILLDMELLELLDPSHNRNLSEATHAFSYGDSSENIDMNSEEGRKCNDKVFCPIDEEILSYNDVS